MGLISGLVKRLQRARYAWSWRLRYWWLDTHSGAQARIVLCCLSALVAVADIVHASIAALTPRPAGSPQHAVIWWVVYLVVALIAAAVSFAMRPRLDQKQQDQPAGPTTEDGQSVVRYWGTHWVDDEFLLAWKVVGRDPIKGKGGK